MGLVSAESDAKVSVEPADVAVADQRTCLDCKDGKDDNDETPVLGAHGYAIEEAAKAVAGQLYAMTNKLISSMEQGLELKNVLINKTILGSFELEQENFRRERELHYSHASADSVAPWEDCCSATDARKQILSLSFDPSNFLRDPPDGSGFTFDYNSYSGRARGALEQDPTLRKMRFELVPKRLSEEKFWRNYFYRVSLIKKNVDNKVKELANRKDAETESNTTAGQAYPSTSHITANQEVRLSSEPTAQAPAQKTCKPEQDVDEADGEVSDEKIAEIEREVLANFNEFELVEHQNDSVEETDWDRVITEVLVDRPSPALSEDKDDVAVAD
ncbi:unnamed protein product [Soboliphyme baturini]|uniref:BSD domain-containing protein n=1 Tax=Soboliphyme baturini TaxID=241478 RepID=A0A183J027_9BILA|nr:unnamed protein product [Soboliphyme baturini]